MRRTRGAALLLFAALLLAAPNADAEAVIAPPRWTSDLVRDARPITPIAAWVFTVGGSGDQQVTLAPSFVLERTGAAAFLYDRLLCREFTWTAGAPTLGSTSCYAAAAAELLAGGRTQPPLEKRSEGRTVEYRRGPDLVARTRGGLGPLDAETAAAFGIYLARRTDLDPAVRHDLAKAGVMPAEVEIFHQRAGRPQRESLTFSDLRPVRLAYPLPPGLTAYPAVRRTAGPTTTTTAGIDAAVLAAEQRFPLARPTVQALLANTRAALADRKPMAALFWFFELSQQYTGYLLSPQGAAAVTEARGLLRQALADREAARFFAASNLAAGAATPANRAAAARYLAGLKLEGLPFATFREVTFANLVQGGTDGRADPALVRLMPGSLPDHYWRHVAAYPWASNVYKDLGDTYLRANDTDDAWLAYDLGRAIDSDWKGGVMRQVVAIEDSLRRTEPDLF